MYYYYLNVIQSLLLSKYNFKNISFFFLQNITISIFLKNIKNTLDIEIFKSFAFLQCLTIKKPKILYYTFYEKKKKIIAARCFVTLSNIYLFSFLTYFINCFIYYFQKKNYYILNYFLKKTFHNFSFSISDITLFHFLPSYYYDWVSTIVFSFNFKSSFSSTFFLPSYLSCFSIPLNLISNV